MSDACPPAVRHDDPMDTLTPIDLSAWPRREHFEHFSRVVPCTYAITVDIDVTDLVAALREAGRKTYPTQIWALSTAVNGHQEFRPSTTPAGEPAVWDVVHPTFTIFNPDRETFASVPVRHDSDYSRFHDAVAAALREHRTATTLFPQGTPPANRFDVSSLPWTSFSGFDLHVRDAWTWLAPCFTLGRHHVRDGRTLLPLAVTVHHAAADGFHTARLIEDVRGLLGDPSWVG